MRSLAYLSLHLVSRLMSASARARTRIVLALAIASVPVGAWAQAVPVTVAEARSQDVPVAQRAIGTVQAFQSVLIRVRVDGTLDSVKFQEGQHVKPGDVLAQLDPRPYQAVLDQVLAKRAADEATLAQARLDLVRYNELAQSQAASRQKQEQIRATVAQSEATVRGDDATIAAAQLNLSFTRITAPIEGRVGLRAIDPGNFIRAADPGATGLVTIAQIQPVAVLFTLPQDAMPQLRAAMRRGRLPIQAFASDDRTPLGEGELLTLDSAIDATTGTIKLKAIFPNKDEALWPGQFINARLQLDMLRGAITVPSVAVQRGQNGLYVYAVKPDNIAIVIPVEVAQDDGTIAVLTKGVAAGDRVVVGGQSRLAPGSRVTVSVKDPAT